MEQIAALVSLFGVVLIARPTSFFSFGSGGAPPATGNGDAVGSGAIANGTTSTDHVPSYDLDSATPEQRAAGVGVALLGVIGMPAFQSI